MNHRAATVDSLTDEEVIDRILLGEREAFEVLVRRYNQRLYRAGMAILNNDSEVEDVMQEAYMKAYENLAKFARRSAFSTWLTRIMINESLMRMKKMRKLTGLTSHEEQPEVQTPFSNLVQAELKLTLENAILGLPEKYRTVFILRELENMSVAETQACLAISPANVKIRLNRAKSMLRGLLSSYINSENLIGFHLTRCDRLTAAVMGRIL